jgi:hypothetical protein
VLHLAIDVIKPVDPSVSRRVFKNDPNGVTSHGRVLKILRGFVNDDPIPPVWVVRDQAGTYALRNGAHRFYCSIAAGFTQIPAIEVSTEPGSESAR